MVTRYRFRVEEFERAFQGVPHVELLRGEVYRMSPIGPKHFYAVMRLDHRLREALGTKAVVAVQSPLRLSEDSEPEPDLLVLKPPLERYADRLPTPEDVLLLVEVADTSLEFDREVKLPLYAEVGIPEVWLVNLKENLLEVHQRPRGGRYREIRLFSPEEEVSPSAFPGVRLPWA
ncbi:Endonuclease, Uma2 family (restriction endonuclease fold) [Thermus arciformis]|uniref:Endonuclease, Uma2 family (Restriction endonuclease fold) n=1 Tax=Thermus arciformis TaxID=482827 RepID=A0A1G7E252_9DEIN|nr:Uma2 family endonuclease [Thermus arciformis]SDE57556.1 Endonuclease, Uma2 family (restriction endonuclease fold) [Thermus arciformis]